MRSTVNSQNDKPLADWDSCPSGELQRLVGRLNVIEQCAQRKRICFCGVGVMLMAVGLVVGVGTLMAPSVTNYGGLTCQQCQSHFVAFHDQLASELDNQTASLVEIETRVGMENTVEATEKERTEIMDSALAERMKTHLANCQRCEEQFNTRYPGITTNHQTRGLNHWMSLDHWASGGTTYQRRALFTVARVPVAI